MYLFRNKLAEYNTIIDENRKRIEELQTSESEARNELQRYKNNERKIYANKV